MDIMVMTKELNEYFKYIKTIYINEFSRYMTVETRERLFLIDNIIELDEDSSFKVKNKNKICFNLNLEKYIEENRLNDENNLKDLSSISKEYIAYLIQNKDNVYEIIKNKLLKEIIIYFIDNKDDVISMGVAEDIVYYLVKKYKFPCEKMISKEKDVSDYVKQIVGEETLYFGVINKKLEIIEKQYDSYIEEERERFEEFMSFINQIYSKYKKSIRKVYLTDSLYEYENLDFKINKKINAIQTEKNDLNIIRYNHLNQIAFSLKDINRYRLLFSYQDQVIINNNLFEIEKILKSEKIDENYSKALEIEDDSLKYAIKVWKDFLMPIDRYKEGYDFNLLLELKEQDGIIEAMYVNNNYLNDSKKLSLSYGYIIEPMDDAIIYSSTKPINYHKTTKNNYNTINIGDVSIEIDNQEDSKLLTPPILFRSDIKANNIQNRMLLNSKKIKRVGVYCYVLEDYENDSNYLKAEVLSEESNLPIIKMTKFPIYSGSKYKA